MPLKRGYSSDKIGSNIKKMEDEGYPKKQALAASLSSARKSAEKAGKKKIVKKLMPKKK